MFLRCALGYTAIPDLQGPLLAELLNLDGKRGERWGLACPSRRRPGTFLVSPAMHWTKWSAYKRRLRIRDGTVILISLKGWKLTHNRKGNLQLFKASDEDKGMPYGGMLGAMTGIWQARNISSMLSVSRRVSNKFRQCCLASRKATYLSVYNCTYGTPQCIAPSCS